MDRWIAEGYYGLGYRGIVASRPWG